MSIVVNALWIGKALSKLEFLCLSSFVQHGHHVNLFRYNKLENVPEGIHEQDAREILAEEEIYTYPNGSYSAVSNLFRWELLRQRGGIWIDTDVICLKPFDFDQEFVFGHQDSETINAAIVGLPKGHKIAVDLAYLCRNPNTFLPHDKWKTKKLKFIRRFFQGNRRDNITWGEGGGVRGFTNYIRHNKLDGHALPISAFYPIHFLKWEAFIDGSVSLNDSTFKDSYAVHLWHEMFRQGEFDKNKPFPENSFLYECEQKFLCGL
ncbi:MAG: glycosyltransferase [Planctomycetota bacterium]|nr:glycosyltransferase [Planctomycetota bacterium]